MTRAAPHGLCDLDCELCWQAMSPDGSAGPFVPLDADVEGRAHITKRAAKDRAHYVARDLRASRERGDGSALPWEATWNVIDSLLGRRELRR